MESHKKVLGILFLTVGAFQILVMFLLSLVLTTIFSYALRQVDPADQDVLALILDLARYIPAMIIIFVGLPSVIAGVALLARQSWAMIFALVVGCFSLLSFPFGTALGIYTIWVYSEEQRLKKVVNPA